MSGVIVVGAIFRTSSCSTVFANQSIKFWYNISHSIIEPEGVFCYVFSKVLFCAFFPSSSFFFLFFFFFYLKNEIFFDQTHLLEQIQVLSSSDKEKLDAGMRPLS